MARLVACYISENDAELLDLSISSIINGVDYIYVIYSKTEGDKTLELMNKYKGKITFILEEYLHRDKQANGKQRNKYLQILKEKEEDCWVLVLDSDEIVDDISLLREYIDYNPRFQVASIKMRHLIKDLQHEDATQPIHYVPRRLFKWTNNVTEYSYPLTEHPVLQGNYTIEILTEVITIWHLAYAKALLDIKKKYLNHCTKSEMHSKAYLDRWYRSHLFGTYPSSQFNPTDLPQIIKDFFLIPNLDDELYFQNRGLEVKHFIDASHWKDYFKCNNVLEIGCGLGHRVYALRSYGVNAYGFDINKWAIENNPYSNEWFLQKDITIPWEQSHTYDLLILYDVLEHIEEDKINIALLNCFNSLLDKKHVLFSIPFLGDPNLEKDSTHKTKKSREWWIEQIQKAGFKIIEIPKHFLFNHQLIIAEKISHD